MVFLEWDPRKALANWRKHRVSFDEAATVALDPEALLVPDLTHSAAESRFMLIGMSEAKRILTVVFTYRRSRHHEKEIYRIISGRPASKVERKAYAEAASAKG
jgi:uncharacterized DUF497 family protein